MSSNASSPRNPSRLRRKISPALVFHPTVVELTGEAALEWRKLPECTPLSLQGVGHHLPFAADHCGCPLAFRPRALRADCRRFRLAGPSEAAPDLTQPIVDLLAVDAIAAERLVCVQRPEDERNLGGMARHPAQPDDPQPARSSRSGQGCRCRFSRRWDRTDAARTSRRRGSVGTQWPPPCPGPGAVCRSARHATSKRRGP